MHGRPAGAVTAAEVETARAAWNARRAGLPPPRPGVAARPPDGARLPDSTPLPEEHLAPGRLELAAKFSELPRPLPVRGGVRIAVPTGEWTVTAILPAPVWRRLEQSAKTYPQWLAALSGSLARFADGEIALQHPTVQVFERKARPEVAAEAKTPEPDAPQAEAPDAPAPAAAPKPPEAKAAETKAPAAPASNPNILRATLSLKGQRKP